MNFRCLFGRSYRLIVLTTTFSQPPQPFPATKNKMQTRMFGRKCGKKITCLSGDTFKGPTSLHAHIQRLQWEHQMRESQSEQLRNNCINLVYSTTSVDSLFILDYPIVTSPNLRFSLTSPLSLSLEGLQIIFEFCFAVVKLTE